MFRVVKQELCELERCYAVGLLKLDGELWYTVASEAKLPCVAFAAADQSRRRTIWEQPGGCMSIVTIPGKADEFLAIQRFYSLFRWDQAEIVWIYPDGRGGFQRKVLVQLPYIHRFDVLRSGETLYFVGCTLSNHKDELTDWRTGGRVYTGQLDLSNRRLAHLELLRDDFFKNHGYCHREDEAGAYGLIGCEQGIFRIRPPRGERGWELERIFDRPVSDMALADIDGDGVPELAAIEPFHGAYFRIYKRRNDRWEQIFEHPEITEFYHVVWGGVLCGRNCFIGGCRRGKQQLFVAYGAPDGRVAVQTLDEGAGPSNVTVWHDRGEAVILSANREQGRGVLYRLMPERE